MEHERQLFTFRTAREVLGVQRVHVIIILKNKIKVFLMFAQPYWAEYLKLARKSRGIPPTFFFFPETFSEHAPCLCPASRQY